MCKHPLVHLKVTSEMQAIVPYWTTKVAYIPGVWHLGLNEKARSLLERKEHGCHRAFCWQLLPAGTCVVASMWDQEQMTLRRSCAAAARGQAAGQSPPRPWRVWELWCETRKLKGCRCGQVVPEGGGKPTFGILGLRMEYWSTDGLRR
jgi:hypothetical protein